MRLEKFKRKIRAQPKNFAHLENIKSTMDHVDTNLDKILDKTEKSVGTKLVPDNTLVTTDSHPTRDDLLDDLFRDLRVAIEQKNEIKILELQKQIDLFYEE